ncbi:hypothetical protein [Streptomyces sp. NPDC047315]|uniref:hypothetical protein n=1 Tax=Streptomyces sp. NPDC047315 TaxID=3155142 RepID=UPI0033ED043B
MTDQHTQTTTHPYPQPVSEPLPPQGQELPAAPPVGGVAQAQEAEATGRHVAADLCGQQVYIIPPGAWRQSWQRLLNSGQIDAFAETILSPDSYELFLELDPTNDEFGEMIASAAERAGESLGKSRGPGPSSRTTRRR